MLPKLRATALGYDHEVEKETLASEKSKELTAQM